jgi:hypothetical protein
MSVTFTAKAIKALCFGGGILFAMSAVGRLELGPVPEGDPLAQAAHAIARAGQSCPQLASAVQLEDGSIQAVCADGERYRIATVYGVEVSLHCGRARAMGISNC